MNEADYTVIATTIFPRLLADIPVLMFLYEVMQSDKFPQLRARLQELESHLAQSGSPDAV